MALTPSETVRFDSWKQLRQWLPEASESQLMTVFVWAGAQTDVPPGEQRDLARVRKESFELLYWRSQEAVIRFLIRRYHCRDRHMVADVAQDVLLQVYRSAEQFDPERSYWGWLYSIARSKYIDALRRIRPGDIGLGLGGDDEDALEKWFQKHARSVPSPEATAIAKEEHQRTEAAIARLPRTQRLIVQLKRDGIKGTEIAQQIGKSQAYVSQAFHEALEVIRNAIEE
jgi:RNA polymerase sigma-70 factor (ECF subfamily)